MAGRGPAPKDPTKRRRRNADPAPHSVVAPDDVIRGPELPEGVRWHPRTLAWWDTWRTSPQAQTFTETDWCFLVDTALIHTLMWNGNIKAAGELRIRVAKFGATPEDRARLRMEIDSSTEQQASGKPSGGRYGHLRVVAPEAMGE